MYKIIHMAWDLYSSSIGRRCLDLPRLSLDFPLTFRGFQRLSFDFPSLSQTFPDLSLNIRFGAKHWAQVMKRIALFLNWNVKYM